MPFSTKFLNFPFVLFKYLLKGLTPCIQENPEPTELNGFENFLVELVEPFLYKSRKSNFDHIMTIYNQNESPCKTAKLILIKLLQMEIFSGRLVVIRGIFITPG